jgi:hypothetical protein
MTTRALLIALQSFLGKQWVIDNVGEVRQFLEDRFGQPMEIDGVGYAMVTHHPMFIASRITDFSCVNLAQLMRTYEREGRWIQRDPLACPSGKVVTRSISLAA